MKWNLTPDKFMSESEVKRLLKVSEDKMLADKMKGRCSWIRIHMLISLACKSGLRVAEIANIRIKDMNLSKEPYLSVIGKGNKHRVVYISNDLKKQIKEHIKAFDLKGDDFLLTSSHGKAYSRRGLQKHFKNVCRLAGLPMHYSIHSCRHSYATKLYQSSKDLRLVQKQLGHSSVNTTCVYADCSRETILDAVNGVF